MIKIEEAFKNKKAFIPFVLAGYPNLETTEKFILKMAEAGADLIEIGIPFSDPVAEGTVIQAASKVALSGNMTTNDIFDMAEKLKGKVKTNMAGTISYMVCNDKECMPPTTKKFSIPIQ